jgi:hypothetical protein
MALKAELKKAITSNSKYVAVKVWKPEVTESWPPGTYCMTVEITVRKKKKVKKAKRESGDGPWNLRTSDAVNGLRAPIKN